MASAAGGCCARSGSNRMSAISTKATRRSPCWSAPASFMAETGQPFAVALSGHARRESLHHPYGGRRRIRPFFPGPDGAVSRPAMRRRSSGIPLRELLALGRQNPDDADEPFNMAYLAMRRERGGQWRQPAAWPGQPAHLRAALSPLAGGRSAGRPRDQRRAHADLGFGGGGRALDGGLRQGALARDLGRPWRRISAGSPTRSSGRCAPRAGKPWSNMPAKLSAGRWPPPAQPPEVIARDPGAAGSRAC